MSAADGVLDQKSNQEENEEMASRGGRGRGRGRGGKGKTGLAKFRGKKGPQSKSSNNNDRRGSTINSRSSGGSGMH